MADRNEFLENVRRAAALGRAHRVTLNPAATHTQSYVGAGADPVATLLAEWQAVGGQGSRVSGDAAARDYISRFIAEHRCTRVLRWAHPLLERLNLDAVCGAAAAVVLGWNDLARQESQDRWPSAFSADLGITSVDWAVAETGSLALCARPDQGRVVSLLPPRYLAIVEPSQIVPDLFDLFERLEQIKTDLPSNIVLVTGPSKTGDIEL
ncbi:MAG: hypothetical protein EHM42_10095, partial [Planctomycetaceae bacterium]